MISASIVADSISSNKARITTFLLTYPRFAHAEVMTHRMFSRNASSSRAIPVKRQIQMIIDNPAIPMAFTKNQKGMQGGEALSGDDHDKAVAAWLKGRDEAVKAAQNLADLEVHKQYANRLLEPFAHITVVLTATDFDNFFALRIHPAALPEMQELATKMYEARMASVPVLKNNFDWHLPFTGEEGVESIAARLMMSVARCARVSYLNHEGKKPTWKEDEELYKRLVCAHPMHASPAEHQAMALDDPNERSGNFKGWRQYRKQLVDENIVNFEDFKGEKSSTILGS